MSGKILGLLVLHALCGALPVEQVVAQNQAASAVAADFKEQVIFYPEERPGFAAWVKLFQFGNGEVGLSFDTIRKAPNPRFMSTSIEFMESFSFPYQYSRTLIPASHPDLVYESHYMKSSDGGRTWQKTGRDWGNGGAIVGYADGRLVRVVWGQQSWRPERGLARHATEVDESRDGGNTWKLIARVLDGFVFSVHRLRKLRDGSLIAMGPQHPSFGPGGSRQRLGIKHPGEIDVTVRDQAAFMHSPDGGYTWTGPHYVLSSVRASESDFVELPDGRLLIINSSVQLGAQTRQFVHRISTGFVCDPVIRIEGAGFDSDNVQSGIVPETVEISPDGLIAGARRGSEYACSNDLGKTWHVISGVPECNYQPQSVWLSDGRLLTAWHLGTDSALGQQDMCIGSHSFRIQANLPPPTQLTLVRSLSADGSQYVNTHRARLTGGGNPISGKTIQLHVKRSWNPDGTYNTTPIDQAEDVRTGVTDQNGVVEFTLDQFNITSDIHLFYFVEASFTPEPNDHLPACKSPNYSNGPLTSKRNTPQTYPIYQSENTLFLTGQTAEQYPELVDLLNRFDTLVEDATFRQWADAMGGEKRAREIIKFLMANYLLSETVENKYRWHRAVHCGPNVIAHVRINELDDYAS